MMATWGIHLVGERPTTYEKCCALWRATRARWHVATWFLVGRTGDGLGMARASKMFLQGLGALVE